ncbi:MAG: glycine betaine ABC transporter substrate-binding protein [Nocardioidaceae bacterium]
MRRLAILIAGMLASLLLAACSSASDVHDAASSPDSESSTTGPSETETTPTTSSPESTAPPSPTTPPSSTTPQSSTTGATGPSSPGTVRIAVVSGSAESMAVSQLWRHVLTQHGYQVQLTRLNPSVAFQAVTSGQCDVYLDAWITGPGKSTWRQYKAGLEDLGSWYDQATINLAVPNYVQATTIGDLKGKAHKFDGTITGIEPSAGLMSVTGDKVMHEYGLTGYQLRPGTTPGMLNDLKQSIATKKPIVVTLWHPSWAYDAYDLRDLKDPKHAYGDAQEIHAIARKGYSAEHPDLASAIGDFTMADVDLAALMHVVYKNQTDPREAVDTWAAGHPELVADMMP